MPTRPPAPRGRTIVFGFVPALDGIRAVAVLGVLLYHGGAPLSSGGFLGVNMFFVLSGFLITSLLLGEWTRRLTIRLGQFWARRARRLLPALLLMLVGVALFARFFSSPGEFSSLRLDSLSTLFYVANWHFIVGGSNYFAQSAQPSPLSHMWSLSIEEQFYILWPPVVLGLLHLGRRLRPSRQLWPVLAAAVVGVLVSAADMRWSYLHHANGHPAVRGDRHPEPGHPGRRGAGHRADHVGPPPPGAATAGSRPGPNSNWPASIRRPARWAWARRRPADATPRGGGARAPSPSPPGS